MCGLAKKPIFLNRILHHQVVLALAVPLAAVPLAVLPHAVLPRVVHLLAVLRANLTAMMKGELKNMW